MERRRRGLIYTERKIIKIKRAKAESYSRERKTCYIIDFKISYEPVVADATFVMLEFISNFKGIVRASL